jgi:arginine transport system ATP-binding protein
MIFLLEKQGEQQPSMSIELTAINSFYGIHQVLRQITLTIASGSTVALLGPSGAGKSTLLRAFNLLTVPQTGTLTVMGCSIDCARPVSETTAHEIRKQVGMVFQQYHLWPHKTVLDNLIEAPQRVLKLSKPMAQQEAITLLERLGLTPHVDRYPLQLSGGQQQRVAIARALMMRPKILLFDEPTAALDPEITMQITTIMQELSQTGMTQVIVTHDTEVARKVATHLIYMEQGEIVEQGDARCFTHPKTAAFAHYLSH